MPPIGSILAPGGRFDFETPSQVFTINRADVVLTGVANGVTFKLSFTLENVGGVFTNVTNITTTGPIMTVFESGSFLIDDK
ncbi:hypothetical protein [Paenibacillus herberti]|uniref:Uncharacterized protein n=1 Tax=Paenibacillus herberti TaxID=1619309 RepID=A0A229NYD5_9BACL|nr:hypothetical protein [Paenibacillus herberti]OXM14771.1 hypothetical protein CGZ75_18020 [Paenibacillus herberti]